MSDEKKEDNLPPSGTTTTTNDDKANDDAKRLEERAERRKHAQDLQEQSKEEMALAKLADSEAAAKIAADLGLEVAGGFQKSQAELEKAAVQALRQKQKDAERKRRQMVKNEPTTMWRENKNMRKEDRPSWLMSNADNRKRHYKEMCSDHKRVLHKRERRKTKEDKWLVDQMEEGFCFEQLIVRDHIRRKPTPGRMIKCVDQAHRKECRKCMFDESGTRLVSCGMDKAIKVWDVHSCKLIAELYAHRVGVTSIDVRGTVVVKKRPVTPHRRGQHDDAGKHKKREEKESSTSGGVAPQQGEEHYTRRPNTTIRMRPTMEDDGDFRVLSSDANGMLMLWEGIEDPLPSMTIRAHDVTIHDCQFSPDSYWLLTCSEDRSLRVFDAWDGTMLFQFQGHEGAVTACAWSPNGNIFISGGDFEDPTIRLWDAANAIVLMYFNQDGKVGSEEEEEEEEEEENKNENQEEDEEGQKDGGGGESKERGNDGREKSKKTKAEAKKRRKMTTEERMREDRKIERLKRDKRSGRRKAMDLFERKVREGLGILWMNRTSMLLLCEAYLIVGDPQVGMTLFDEMIRLKYRATTSLMELIWLFMKSGSRYLNLRERQRRKEYGEDYDKRWEAPKMDTGEPGKGSHVNDVAFNDRVLLTTMHKPEYITGALVVVKTKKQVLEKKKQETRRKERQGQREKNGFKKRMSKKEQEEEKKRKDVHALYIKERTVDDSYVGTSRSIPWRRGNEWAAVTEMVRLLRGRDRSTFVERRETRRRPHVAAHVALSDPFLMNENDERKRRNKKGEEEEELSIAAEVSAKASSVEEVSVATSLVEENGRYVRPMSAPSTRSISVGRARLLDAVSISAAYAVKPSDKRRQGWFGRKEGLVMMEERGRVEEKVEDDVRREEKGGEGDSKEEESKEKESKKKESKEEESKEEESREEKDNEDYHHYSASSSTLLNPAPLAAASDGRKSITPAARRTMSKHIVQHIFDVAVSRIEYMRVDHLPEVQSLKEEQRRNDLLRMGIDPDIEAKAERERQLRFKRLHKQINVSEHSSLERIQEVYKKLLVDVPIDAQLSQEGRLYILMEHLGDERNPVTADDDQRVVNECRVRFMRQWRQVGQVKKYVKRKINVMDEIMRKLSGVQPWRTDVNPNGANGKSTFLISTFDRRYGKGHTDWINSLHFCHDGQHVVSASSDRTVRLWNPTTGEQITTLRGFPGWVNSVTVSHDQEWLVATSDHIISVWNFREALERATLKKQDEELRMKRTNEINCLKKQEMIRLEEEMEKERKEARKKKKKKRIKGSNESDTAAEAKQRNQDQQDRHRSEAANHSPYVLRMKEAEKDMAKAVKRSKKGNSKPAYELHGHCDLVYSAYFNADRHRIVSASHDMSLRVWQIIPTVPDSMILPPKTNQLLVHSIRLSWRSPSENGYPITNYVVQIKREDEIDWIHTRHLGNCMSDNQFYRDQHREATVDHLRSGSFYEFRLAAINRVGQAEFSPVTPAVRTEPDVPEEIMYRVECITAYPRAMMLQWNEPNSWGIAVRTFEIQYRGGGFRKFGDGPTLTITKKEGYKESELMKKKMKKQALETAMTHAERQRRRHAQVERKKRAAMSPEKRKEYLAQELQKMHRKCQKIALRKGRDIDKKYQGAMSATVRGLIPGNSYQFRARATNNKGPGEYSPVGISTATVSLPPMAMPSIYTSDVTPFGCRVCWQKPDARGMPVSEYSMFWCKIENRITFDKFTRIRTASNQQNSRRNAITITAIDDSMLDVAHIEIISLQKLRSKSIDLMPFAPSGMKTIALADMENPRYVDVSGMEPGCDYVFCAASRNQHGYSKLSPISELMTTESTQPATPPAPGTSHASSTGLTLHFVMPHDNGSLITTIYVIVREGDRENGKCGHPLEFPLSEARPAMSDDPTQMKFQVLYRNTNDRSMCMIRMGGLSGAMLYGMQVAASNDVGVSPYSEMSATVSTLPAIPPNPPRFEPDIENVTPTSISCKWSNSDGDGGSPVCGFLVIAAVKTLFKSLGAGSKKKRAQQKSGSTNLLLTDLDQDVVVAPEITTSSSIETRALEMVSVPKGFRIVGLIKIGTNCFTLRPVTQGSHYRFRIAAYNRAGPGNFSPTSHPPTQIPNRNQYITMEAERKKREEEEALLNSLEDDEKQKQ